MYVYDNQTKGYFDGSLLNMHLQFAVHWSPSQPFFGMSPRRLAVHPTYTTKKLICCAVLKAAFYEKQIFCRRFKRNTKTLNLGYVSSFSPCAINLLRIVERGSTLSNKVWLCCSFIKLTICHAYNLLTLRDKLRICASRDAHRMKPSIL